MFDRLEQSFLAAAASQPSIDPALQNALGVLYNISGNYERASDAFRAAVGANPDVINLKYLKIF